jgi:hypothetical protein
LKVLAFDIASATGWAFGSTDFGIEKYGVFKHTDYYSTYLKFEELIKLWKPDMIVTAKPTRYYMAMRKMFLLTGTMLAAAAKHDVNIYTETKGKSRKSTDFPNDSSIKKAIFGDGKVSKAEICKRYNIKDENAADAGMFVEYVLKQERS